MEKRFQTALGDDSLKILVAADWGSANFQHRELISSALKNSNKTEALQSSISHTNGMGGFVLSSYPVGFDIETTSRVTHSIVNRVSSAQEIASAPNLASLWCAKEAAFKGLRAFNQPQVVTQIEIAFTGDKISGVDLFRVENEKKFDAFGSIGGCYTESGLTYCVLLFRT